jgi:hypothetical protein
MASRRALVRTTVAALALGALAVSISPADAGAPAADGVWVLKESKVNPAGDPPPESSTGLSVAPGRVAFTYLDAREGWDRFSSSFEATYDPPPRRVEPGTSVPIEVTVEGRITRQEDVRYTGMAVTIVQDRYWDETVGVEQNCVGAPGGGLDCSAPATATGELFFDVPAAGARGDTFEFAVAVLNCGACAVRYTYAFEPADGAAVGTVASVDGDVEVQRAGALEPEPLTAGAKLREGDTILTGFEAGVVVSFGDTNELTVPQLSSVRLDELVIDPGKRVRTQVYLYVGAVRARVRHVPAIRSDFSVTTPTANASVRGSEMEVRYSEETGATTVEVLEDEAVVSGPDGDETVVALGEVATVGGDGVVEVAGAAPDEVRPGPRGGGADDADGAGDADDGGASGAPVLVWVVVAAAAGAAVVTLVVRARARH